jgi:cysteine desulfurase
MERIYFDNAATTAMDPRVTEAMLPYLQNFYGNPSSIYSYGRETRLAIEQARKTTAKLLGAHPAEMFFTSGGTESSNTVILGAVRDLGCIHIITSQIEHHATLHTVEYLAKRGEVSVGLVNLLPNGQIDLNDLENQLEQAPGKTLVTLMHANNEIGNLTDIHRVGEMCLKYGAYFHSDAVQTVGHFQFNLRETPVHFISASAHKFHGPKGAGLLYINENVRIQPYIHGGGQERNMRAGTENVYGIVGFVKALEIATSELEKDMNHILGIKTYMIQQLKLRMPSISFNGDAEGSSNYTVLNISLPKSEKSEMLLMNLDMSGICASGGSACTSGAQQGSHVIRAVNPDPNRIPVRFSFSKYNKLEEVDVVIDRLNEFI